MQIHFECGYAGYVSYDKISDTAVLFFAVPVPVHSRKNAERFVRILFTVAHYPVNGQVFDTAEIDRGIVPIVCIERNKIVLRVPVKILYRPVLNVSVYMQPIGIAAFKAEIFNR